MSLQPGTHLGPYEILTPLGAGGMGEVWKARDPKLDRFVAIKVLPPDFAADADRLRRFQQEARVVASLSHPHVVHVYEAGEFEGAPYLVMELLEGETLRERLRGKAIPPRRAAELVRDVALGLAAAHSKGILHRDLKPENIFLMKDGRVKVLDFGLAKARVASTDSRVETAAFTAAVSEPGQVVGTSGYMSPEQVRGEVLDARSDLFSLGVVLWEMVTGDRPFKGDSSIEVMHAILKDDPPELTADLKIPPALERILYGCLAKAPEGRFHSAHDLAFALEGMSSSGISASGVAGLPLARARKQTLLWAVGLTLAGFLGGASLWFFRAGQPSPAPTFKALTFRRGNLVTARFTPDGQSIVYSAAWEGRPSETFFCRADGTGTRSLELVRTSVQAVNARGELLVLLKPERWASTSNGWGTLALTSLDGGMPKELLAQVQSADFGPDGQSIGALIHTGEGNQQRLEYPLGHTLLETSEGILSRLRISPDGEQVAVLLQEKGEYVLTLLNRQGARRDLYRSREGLGQPVWIQGGRALAFLKTDFANSGSPLLSVDLAGRVRRLHSDSTLGTVWDASPKGQLLFERTPYRTEVTVRRGAKEVDLSQGIQTFLSGLSADGDWALLTDFDDGQHPHTYLRRTDGSPAKSLGASAGAALSPDGKWVLLFGDGPQGKVRLVPAGLGAEREFKQEGLEPTGGGFSLDGRTLWIGGTMGKGGVVLVPFDLEGHARQPVSIPSQNIHAFSPADDRVLWTDKGGRAFLSPLQGGAPMALPWSLQPEERIAGWDRPGEVLVLHPVDAVHERVDLLEPLTGRRSVLATFTPKDPVGVIGIESVRLSRDRKTVALTCARIDRSDLILAEGLVPK